jgi:salicylate hydroxylase
VFGGLFSRLRSWDQVPSLMEAFQDLRKGRCEAMASHDLMVAELAWIGPGPEREGRNKVMGENMNRGLDNWDDRMMQDQWDEISEVFCYNAMDAAADWWAGWGMLGEMAKKRARDHMEISVRVAPASIVHTPSVVSINHGL